MLCHNLTADLVEKMKSDSTGVRVVLQIKGQGGTHGAAASYVSQRPDRPGAGAWTTLIFQIPVGYLHTCSEGGEGGPGWKKHRNLKSDNG